MSDTNGTPKRLSRARRKLRALQLKKQLAEARISLARTERRAKLEEVRAQHAWPREIRNHSADLLREAFEQKRQQGIDILEAKRLGKQLGEGNFIWDWVSGYQDLVDRLRAPDGLLLTAISIAADRMYGCYWPFFRTWNDLALLRGASRICFQTSCLARGAINGVAGYIVGDGFKYKANKKEDCPEGLRQAVQNILDDNSKLNNWPALEKSCVVRDSRDGEWFLRSFPLSSGLTAWRWMEPEQVIQPAGSELKEWSFGIQNPTDPYDVETRLAFYFCPNGNNSDGEEVPGHDVICHMANVDGTVKRGIPALAYDTYDFLKIASRLIDNMTEGAAIQASIAYIREWESPVTGDMASDFVTSDADYNETNPWTGNTDYVRRHKAGSIDDIPKGMKMTNPPGSPSAGAWVEISQAALSAVAITWNAPKWLLSNDTDLNYASSLTAESPFVKTGTHEQCVTYKPRFLQARWRELENWCETKGGVMVEGRRFLYQDIQRFIDIQCEPPSMEVRNKADEAQANAVRVQGGWKSRQTVAAEEGLDWQQERQNIEEYNQSMAEAMPMLQMPGQEGEPSVEHWLRESGFTGIDSHGHKWVDGQQVKRDDTQAGHAEPKTQEIPKEPKEQAQAIKHLGDTVIDELRSLEDRMKGKSMKAQRAAIVPEADKHREHVETFFKGLSEHVKTDAQAKEIAQEMGYQAIKGNKEQVLKELKQKVLNRIGAYVRPYA